MQKSLLKLRFEIENFKMDSFTLLIVSFKLAFDQVCAQAAEVGHSYTKLKNMMKYRWGPHLGLMLKQKIGMMKYQ